MRVRKIVYPFLLEQRCMYKKHKNFTNLSALSATIFLPSIPQRNAWKRKYGLRNREFVIRKRSVFRTTIETVKILPRASTKQYHRLAEIAYYQAGKIVVQTLLPEQPPVALITLNTTFSTSVETYIPLESTHTTQSCSFLESRLISLYGGKAASLLIEYQYEKRLATKSKKTYSTKKRCTGVGTNIFQSTIGNIEIQSATRLATIMVNYWNFYSSVVPTSLSSSPVQSNSLSCLSEGKYSSSQKRKGTKMNSNIYKSPLFPVVLPNNTDRKEKICFASCLIYEQKGCAATDVKDAQGRHESVLDPRVALRTSFPSCYPFDPQEEQEKSASEGKDCHQRIAFESKHAYPLIAYPFRGFFGRRDTQIFDGSPLVAQAQRQVMYRGQCLPLKGYGKISLVEKGEKQPFESPFYSKYNIYPHDIAILNLSNGLKFDQLQKDFVKSKIYISGKKNLLLFLRSDESINEEFQYFPFREIPFLTTFNEKYLRFALSQSKNSLKIFKRGENKIPSFTLLRTSVENIGQKSFKLHSQVDPFQLVKFSNLQRNRVYPGWFRLYLPDVEGADFLKNVANYYFSLGLQTLTRPSLNELILPTNNLFKFKNKKSLVQNFEKVFLCHSNPDISIGISLLRNFAKRRNQLNKVEYFASLTSEGQKGVRSKISFASYPKAGKHLHQRFSYIALPSSICFLSLPSEGKVASHGIEAFGLRKHKEKSQLDISRLLLLEKQIFSINHNGFSIVEKELLYHSLLNNCFAKAFYLVNENRQLLDFFADYLLRFQILRQHQILYLFSAILWSCKPSFNGPSLR